MRTRQWPAYQAVCLMGIIWHQEEEKKRFSICGVFSVKYLLFNMLIALLSPFNNTVALDVSTGPCYD